MKAPSFGVSSTVFWRPGVLTGPSTSSGDPWFVTGECQKWMQFGNGEAIYGDGGWFLIALTTLGSWDDLESPSHGESFGDMYNSRTCLWNIHGNVVGWEWLMAIQCRHNGWKTPRLHGDNASWDNPSTSLHLDRINEKRRPKKRATRSPTWLSW